MAGSHTILLCVIAPGFNINSFTMVPHTEKVRTREQNLCGKSIPSHPWRFFARGVQPPPCDGICP